MPANFGGGHVGGSVAVTRRGDLSAAHGAFAGQPAKFINGAPGAGGFAGHQANGHKSQRWVNGGWHHGYGGYGVGPGWSLRL